MNVLNVLSDILSPPLGSQPEHPPQDIYRTKDPEDALNGNVDISHNYSSSLVDVEEAFDSLSLNKSAKQTPAVANLNAKEAAVPPHKQQICREKEKREVVTVNYISREEVMGHCSLSSCWIIIHGKVYDVTEFIREVIFSYELFCKCHTLCS